MLAERFMSAASVCVLIAAIVALNEHVSQSTSGALSGDLSTELSLAGGRVLDIANEITNSLASSTGNHMVLVLYALGALVLLGLMLRT